MVVSTSWRLRLQLCPAVLAMSLAVLSTWTQLGALASLETVANQELSEGHRRLSKQAHHYEVVHVDTEHHLEHVRRNRRAAKSPSSYDHPGRSRFVVEAFGQRMELDLKLTTGLLSKDFKLLYKKENGDTVVDKTAVNCYYRGKVTGPGQIKGEAVVSTCKGLAGWFSMDAEKYIVEPLVASPLSNGSHLHGVYRAEDAKAGTPVTQQHRTAAHKSPRSVRRLDSMIKHRLRRQAGSDTARPPLYMRVAIVFDNSMYHEFSRSPYDLSDYAGRIIHDSNDLFRSLDISVSLVGVRVMTVSDEFTIYHSGEDATPEDGHDTLQSFLAYHNTVLKQELGEYNNAHLITNLSLGLGGSAEGESVCNGTQAAAFTQHMFGVINTAGVFVHELGHTLAMEHDTGDCYCPYPHPSGVCIMAGDDLPGEVITILNRTWSNCSRDALQLAYLDGIVDCMRSDPGNTPTPAPDCGNGYVERGEQCDCGTPESCAGTCCNPTNCQLVAGAECDLGPCCNSTTCALKQIAACMVTTSSATTTSMANATGMSSGVAASSSAFSALVALLLAMTTVAR